MTGTVDGKCRALLRIPLAGAADGPREQVEAWVDTAFNGGLTIPRELATKLGLTPEATTKAILADGTTVALESFSCYLDWFGGTYLLHAVAGDGATILLGTQLLNGHRLTVDYTTGLLELI